MLAMLARSNGTQASGWRIALQSTTNNDAQGNPGGVAAAANKQRTFVDALRELAKPPLYWRMVLLCGTWFFLSFGFYGFTLWLPSYYKSGGIDDDSDVYLVSIYVGLSNLPGNLFSYLLVDRIGRKWTIILSLILSGACVFVVLAITTTSGRCVVSRCPRPPRIQPYSPGSFLACRRCGVLVRLCSRVSVSVERSRRAGGRALSDDCEEHGIWHSGRGRPDGFHRVLCHLWRVFRLGPDAAHDPHWHCALCCSALLPRATPHWPRDGHPLSLLTVKDSSRE